MATKKSGGSTSLGRDSAGRRLGVKVTDGEWAKAGAIIIRQRGTKYHPGVNVGIGKDDTLFALEAGFVKFTTRKLQKFNNRLKSSKIVNVMPLMAEKKRVVAAAKKPAVKKPAVKKPAVKKNNR